MGRILAVAVLLLASAVYGAEVEMGASLGFQDLFRPDAFNPLRVEVLNLSKSARFALRIEVPNAYRGREILTASVNVPEGSRKVFTFTVLVPAPEFDQFDEQGRHGVALLLFNEKGIPVARAEARARPLPSEILVLAAGPSSGGPEPGGGPRKKTWIRVEYAELPLDPAAYEGVDALVLAEPAAALREIPELASCLRRWVRNGGRLVCWGRDNLYTAPPPSWRGFLPELRGGAEPVRDSESSKIGAFDGASPGAPVVRRFLREEHEVLADDEIGPLAVRVHEGTGWAAFLAFPPGVGGVQWPDRGRALWEELLARGGTPKEESEAPYAHNLQTWARAFADGVCDQVRIEVVDYTVFLVVFLAFAVVVGPGVSLALGKRRGPWIWIAVPALSAAVSAGTYWFALRDRPGGRSLHQITFVDCAPDGAADRFTAVTGLFSADGGWFDMDWPASAVLSGGLESEGELGGGAFGMMRGTGLRRLDGTTMLNVFMNPYSARAFRATGDLLPEQAKLFGGGFALEGDAEEDEDGLVFRNRTSLPLLGGWVLRGDGLAEFQEVEAAGTWDLTFYDPRDLSHTGSMEMGAWKSGLGPASLRGVLSATTHALWKSRWCPFDRTRAAAGDRFLVIALAEVSVVPATLVESGQTAREIVVIRTVLRASP